jgi:tetratricopeptide (TPR) repeat protein
MNRCLDSSAFARFVVGDASADESGHVWTCVRCFRLVDLARRLDAAGVSADTIQRNADTEKLVTELLSVPTDQRPAAAASDRYYARPVAQAFIDLARSEWDRDLNVALTHSHVATIISAATTQRLGFAAEVEYRAWVDRSTIHRKRGEYDAARAALMHARATLPRCSDRELKLAIIAYAEAVICAERDVWAPLQAVELLNVSEAVFAVRDVARLNHVRALRGILDLHSGDYLSAHRWFAVVAESVDAAHEGDRADALRNLANSLIRLRRIDEGLDILIAVRTSDVRLGRNLHVVRDDGLVALAAEMRGEVEVAAEMYGDVQRRFAAAGENEEALLSGKSRALMLVACGRDSEAAETLRALLETAIASKSESDRSRFVAEALAYLRALADRSRLTLDVAADVSSYIDRIFISPAVPFVPPMSLVEM